LAKKLLNMKDQIVFWCFFTLARLFRCLQWLVVGDVLLVRLTCAAFRDGMAGKSGQNNSPLIVKK